VEQCQVRYTLLRLKIVKTI